MHCSQFLTRMRRLYSASEISQWSDERYYHVKINFMIHKCRTVCSLAKKQTDPSYGVSRKPDKVHPLTATHQCLNELYIRLNDVIGSSVVWLNPLIYILPRISSAPSATKLVSSHLPVIVFSSPCWLRGTMLSGATNTFLKRRVTRIQRMRCFQGLLHMDPIW